MSSEHIIELSHVTDVHGLHILVVDDEPNNVVLLERLLAREGYTNVTGVTDPVKGFDIFSTMKVDLVLLDLMMPELDGFGFMEKLVEVHGLTFPLPVLVLTADMTAESMRKSMNLGVYDFVTKPFDPVEIMLRVRNVLERTKLKWELESALIQLGQRSAKQ